MRLKKQVFLYSTWEVLFSTAFVIVSIVDAQKRSQEGDEVGFDIQIFALVPAIICGVIGIIASLYNSVFAGQIVFYTTVFAHCFATIVFVILAVVFGGIPDHSLRFFGNDNPNDEPNIAAMIYFIIQAVYWASSGLWFMKIAERFSQYTEEVALALIADEKIFLAYARNGTSIMN